MSDTIYMLFEGVYLGTAPNRPSSLLIIMVRRYDNCCNPQTFAVISAAELSAMENSMNLLGHALYRCATGPPSEYEKCGATGNTQCSVADPAPYPEPPRLKTPCHADQRCRRPT